MKILQLSTSDSAGGAGRQAYRLHRSLVAAGADSKMFVARTATGDPDVFAPSGKLARAGLALAATLDRLPLKLFAPDKKYTAALAWAPSPVAARIRKYAADVINLHWICDAFLRPADLIGFGRPLVWTLHDMWAFTAAGFYGDTPGRSTITQRLFRRAFARKRRAYARIGKLAFVAPSRWMADCARASELLRDRYVEVIPYGIDHETFRPVAREKADEILGLASGKKRILFGGWLVAETPRKGFRYLPPMLETLRDKYGRDDIELLIFGADKSPNVSFPGFETRYFGHIDDDTRLAALFSAADVFVIPSLQDNLPAIVLEALGCGVPVAGFRTGGIPDMVEHMQNGWLAEPQDAAGLAEGVAWILADAGRRRQFSANARKTVEERFTFEIQATRYLDLYRRILDGKI